MRSRRTAYAAAPAGLVPPRAPWGDRLLDSRHRHPTIIVIDGVRGRLRNYVPRESLHHTIRGGWHRPGAVAGKLGMGSGHARKARHRHPGKPWRARPGRRGAARTTCTGLHLREHRGGRGVRQEAQPGQAVLPQLGYGVCDPGQRDHRPDTGVRLRVSRPSCRGHGGTQQVPAPSDDHYPHHRILWAPLLGASRRLDDRDALLGTVAAAPGQSVRGARNVSRRS